MSNIPHRAIHNITPIYDGLYSVGGKAKGLDELSQNAIELGYIVPEYEEVNLGKLFSVNEKVRGVLNGNQNEFLENLFDRWKGKTIMVRSNSESEDGENSFTGVYESFKVVCNSIDDLQSAINGVLNSMYSELAVQYRIKHRIGEDKMNLIVQEFVDGIDGGYGTIHTSEPQTDEIMKIDCGDSMADEYENATWLRKNVEGLVGGTIPAHLEPYMLKLKQIALDLEKKYGRISLEFIIGKDGKVYLVQKRGLNIPDQKPILDTSELICPLNNWSRAYFENLPVLVVENFENFFNGIIHNPLGIEIPEWRFAGDGNSRFIDLANSLTTVLPNIRDDMYKAWFDRLIKFNRDNPNGYTILIQNGLPEAWQGMEKFYPSLYNSLFSNLKCFLVQDFSAVYSNALAHTQVRSREEKIPVILVDDVRPWWSNTDIKSTDLQTGDLVSIREHKLVRDKRVSDIGLDNDFILQNYYNGIYLAELEGGPELIFPGEEKRLEVFFNSLHYWLENNSGLGNVEIEKSKKYGSWYTFSFENGEFIDISGYAIWTKYVGLKIPTRLVELGYLDYLKDKQGIKTRKSLKQEHRDNEIWNNVFDILSRKTEIGIGKLNQVFPGLFLEITEGGTELHFSGDVGEKKLNGFYDIVFSWLKSKYDGTKDLGGGGINNEGYNVWNKFEIQEGRFIDITGYKMYPKYTRLRITQKMMDLGFTEFLSREGGVKVVNTLGAKKVV